MEAVAANGLNFIPFENDQISKLSPIQLPASTYETSFESDNLSVSVPNVSSSVLLDSNSPYPSTGRAIFTILMPSSQILVVNSAACQLINYSSDELCSMNLEDLISESQKYKLSILLEDFYSDSDNHSSNCGQLLDFLRKDGESVSVSLYLKKIDNRQKCLAIAEPLDQRTGLISLDQNARIYSVDEDIALIFQYDVSELIGVNIHNLLPAIKLPQENEHQWNEALRQQITGKNKNGECFPVSLTISCGNQNSKISKIMIWAYDSLSGLILLNRRLFITNFNNFLIKLLFGFSKNEIINQPIENLIPNFCKNIEKNKKIQNRISNDSNLVTSNGKVEALEQSLNSENSATHELIKSFKSSTTFSHNHLHSPIHLETSNLDLKCESQNVNDFKTLFMSMNLSQYKDHEDSDYSCSEFHNENQEVKHSTNKQVGKLSKDEILPEEKKLQDESLNDFFVQEGRFFGFAQHRDGGYVDIKYQVKTTAVSEENFYCIWLSQDVQKFTDGNHRLSTAKNSSFNTSSLDCSLPKDSICSEQCTRPSTASVISHCDENLTAGEYSQFYTNIKQIGKGAFGYVKMAFRNSDGLLVVTKFIKKQQINIRSWVFHSNLNIKIPLEISLLITLQHPNIVKVLDVFHNDSFVQLVMEKHGAGFDLFEFINRGPKCDEKLKSYIFRQIISAVHYLDSLGILHRDIKDENVIINEKFEVKLIDFGSATFMPPNETFSKFYGTVEYCSPEVLQGNNYKGPELEIWALGVTLYVLTFGENPFYDIEETIKGEFSIPSPISVQLDDLLHKMLDKNVETRITISEVVDDPWINQSVCIDNYRFEEVVRCYDEEAYPPKFVYEIHSEDIYSRRDSVVDSDQLAETNNSNSSLQNTTADDLGDLDDNFQDSHKGVAENLRDKSNISPVVFSSTPVQSRNEGPCKSASRSAEGFANSLSLNDSSRDCVEGNSISTDFRPHDSSGSGESDDSKEEVISPGYSDSRQSEFEENIKRNYFLTKEGSHSSSQETYQLRNDYSCSEYSVAEDESANEYCN